nr:glutaminyl-peptide cyclotransferase [Acidobacteriota bacterium]
MKWAAVLLLSAIVGGTLPREQTGAPKAATISSTERLKVQVLRSYPHDRAAFTQGLLIDGGKVFESTGLVGQSTLREVELQTGRVIRKVDVPRPIFAEGLAVV